MSREAIPSTAVGTDFPKGVPAHSRQRWVTCSQPQLPLPEKNKAGAAPTLRRIPRGPTEPQITPPAGITWAWAPPHPPPLQPGPSTRLTNFTTDKLTPASSNKNAARGLSLLRGRKTEPTGPLKERFHGQEKSIPTFHTKRSNRRCFLQLLLKIHRALRLRWKHT